jgi:hypothetical protein
MDKVKIATDLDNLYMQLALVLDPTNQDMRDLLRSVVERITAIKNELE